MLYSRFIPLVVVGLMIIPAWAQVSAPDTLAAHNAERQHYPGVGSLQWSTELAQYAQSWANALAKRDVLQHRPSSTDNPFAPGQPVGENLFAGSGRRFTVPDAVRSWISEKRWYHYDLDDGNASAKNAPPGCSAPSGRFCGHFTQVIWKKTEYVGCGLAQSSTGARRIYIVCNYYPPGNVVGEKPY
jgi:pathogenesis-related protein 1